MGVEIHPLKCLLMIEVFKQTNRHDCGPACLYMCLRERGIELEYAELKDKFSFTEIGVSIFSLIDVAGLHGIRFLALSLSFSSLVEFSKLGLCLIAYCNEGHFVVVEYIVVDEEFEDFRILLVCPSKGKLSLGYAEFCKLWSNVQGNGIVLVEIEK